MPKTKQCNIKNINSIRKYLTIFAGIFRLTDSELDVLAEMVRYQLLGMYHKTDSDPFSSSAKKIIAERLDMKNPYSVNTYLQRLREKGAVIRSRSMIHPWLVPTGEQTIEINLEWNLNLEE